MSAQPESLDETLEQVFAGGRVGAVIAAIRRYLDIADGEEAFIIATLATAVSKALTGEDPLWLFLIGPPGGGKTEAIRLLDQAS